MLRLPPRQLLRLRVLRLFRKCYAGVPRKAGLPTGGKPKHKHTSSHGMGPQSPFVEENNASERSGEERCYAENSAVYARVCAEKFASVPLYGGLSKHYKNVAF